jgi:hypothetical protein
MLEWAGLVSSCWEGKSAFYRPAISKMTPKLRKVPEVMKVHDLKKTGRKNLDPKPTSIIMHLLLVMAAGASLEAFPKTSKILYGLKIYTTSRPDFFALSSECDTHQDPACHIFSQYVRCIIPILRP